MLFRGVLLGFALLDCCLATILTTTAAHHISSNTTSSSTHHHNLGTWPSQLPWSIPLSPTLTLSLVSYSTFAPPPKWPSIRISLASTRLWIENPATNLQSRSHISTYNNDFVQIRLRDIGNQRILSAHDLAAVLRAVEGFFVSDTPRAFTAHIKVDEQTRMELRLAWIDDDWPRTLPWNLPLRMTPTFADMRASVFLYGRDLEPSLRDGVRDDMSAIMKEVEGEGWGRERINRKSYSTRRVTFLVEGVTSDVDERSPVTRDNLRYYISDVMQLFSMHKYYLLPREFAADYEQRRNERRKHEAWRVRVWLLFGGVDGVRLSGNVSSSAGDLTEA